MGAGCGSACLPFGVSIGGRWSGNFRYFADVSKNVLMLRLFGVFPAFPCFALGAFPLNMALFRVLRGF